MQRLPVLNDTGAARRFLDTFGGIDRNPSIGENTFHDDKNMTADLYPMLSTRKRRGVVEQITSPAGLLGKDALAWVDGHDLVYNGYTVHMDLSKEYQIVDHKEHEYDTDYPMAFREADPDSTFTITIFDRVKMAGDILTGEGEHVLAFSYSTAEDIPLSDYVGKYYFQTGTNRFLHITGGVMCEEFGDYYWINFKSIYTWANEIQACKQLVSMGAYLLIWPDKQWLNTQDLTQFGSMENHVTITGAVTVTLCKQDGDAYDSYSTSDTAPISPENGSLWLDTSGNTPVMKQWAEDTAMWVSIPTTYLMIAADGIGAGFEQWDGVTISGFTGAREYLNQTYVVYGVSSNYLIVPGILQNVNENAENDTPTIHADRNVPEMDYVTECDNRIWGCKYGLVGGKTVNEIYACKLGDFKNWNCFMGISTDSYVASRGSDGVFTGAITYLGQPLFFKENCLEKVYPSASGAHQIVSTILRGVQRGCWRSLQIVGNTLFYKGCLDVYAYNGALPQSVSRAFYEDSFSDARGGALGGKYYISMKDAGGTWHLMTYDTDKGIWHNEDNTCCMMFATCDEKLYYIDEGTKTLVDVEGGTEQPFEWMAESGVIGYQEAGNKYVSRFVIRADMDKGASIKLYLRYGNGQWEPKGEYHRSNIGSFVLPVQPKRCDHVAFRLVGRGGCRIYSIAKYYEQGSDVMW